MKQSSLQTTSYTFYNEKNQRLKAQDLRSMIFAFPTQTYMLASTLASMLV